MSYFSKMIGGGQRPPRFKAAYIGWSWLGAFLGITAVGWLHYGWLDEQGLVMVIGSFGASAVLIYGAINSPLAQPRNLMGGHIISALVGVACCQLLPGNPALAGAIAVATAIAAMQLSGTLHPPGGATALIAVIGGDEITSLGFLYVLFPATSGALIMLLIALTVNNLARDRKYPEYW